MNILVGSLKYIGLYFLFFFIACEKDSEELVKQLIFVESSLPVEKISARGGTHQIEVEWAFTTWRVVAGDVISGQAFIANVSPGIAGSAEGSLTRTSVEIAFESNRTHNINSQELILSSLDGTLRRQVVIAQAPLGLEPFDLVVDPTITYQTISGFGGANMIWGTDYLTPSEMELAFATENGLGLSIFRVRLSSNRNDWAGLINVIKDANSRGVKVIASPWSPPAVWKSNRSTNGGGYLLHEHYGDFANYINEFITFMDSRGAKIDVVSIQNEPDIVVGYEGCEYTVQEMYNFVRNHAGSITGVKVLAAESFNFKHGYTNDILNDPAAADNLDIVGFHIYGGGRHPYPLAEQKGKELWMTEHLYNLDSGNHPGNWTANTSPEIIWDETMKFITDIHDGMTYNWNAYIWWYIRRYYSFLGDGTNGTTRGNILKRGYAMSQYSKFIRPGYVRVGADFDFGIDGVVATAFKGDGKTVVVIVNKTESDDYRVNIMKAEAKASAVSYTTSISHNREENQLSPDGNNVLVELPSLSITTVVLE